MRINRCTGVVLFILFAVVHSNAQDAAPPASPTIDLKVTDDRVVANVKHEFTWEEFPARMMGAVQKYRDAGVPTMKLTVNIDGDASATYRQVRQVIQTCEERGIEKFVLQFDPPRQLIRKPAAPVVRTIEDRELPPLRLRLQAKEDGSLASIHLGDRVLPSMADVQRQLISIVGDDRGPDSIAETLEVRIHADDGLHWKHVGQAYAAAAGFKSDQGELVPLVKSIHIFPEVVEEFAEIEEIQQVEFEPLEIESIDVESTDAETVEGPSGDLSPKGKPKLQTQTAVQRKELAQKNGGNDASEAAVAAALKWIASRQAADGGWNFDHNQSINPIDCPNPGTAERARNGATGLALLPFLGASQTHAEGAYKKQVHASLAYLIKNMKVRDKTGSWNEPEGNMYGHGYAAIAVCDAYARTGDKELLAPAQLSVNYVVQAQDPVGGGWRYQPKQAGDTSSSAVQILALKTGQQGELLVPKTTFVGAMKYLDGVQIGEGGSFYGYTQPGKGRGTTAMGLLCRAQLGWTHDAKGLRNGVDFLDKTGPSDGDMYFNYFATQVMFQYGGKPWERWNAKLRDHLIASQSKEGVTAGSWFFKGGDHGSARGGRLYTTALACLILETYYRETRVLDELRPM